MESPNNNGIEKTAIDIRVGIIYYSYLFHYDYLPLWHSVGLDLIASQEQVYLVTHLGKWERMGLMIEIQEVHAFSWERCPRNFLDFPILGLESASNFKISPLLITISPAPDR